MQRIEAIGGFMQPTSEKGKLPIPEPPSTLKMMIENNSQIKKEIWESLNDSRIEKSGSNYVQRRNSSIRDC